MSRVCSKHGQPLLFFRLWTGQVLPDPASHVLLGLTSPVPFLLPRDAGLFALNMPPTSPSWDTCDCSSTWRALLPDAPEAPSLTAKPVPMPPSHRQRLVPYLQLQPAPISTPGPASPDLFVFHHTYHLFVHDIIYLRLLLISISTHGNISSVRSRSFYLLCSLLYLQHF